MLIRISPHKTTSQCGLFLIQLESALGLTCFKYGNFQCALLLIVKRLIDIELEMLNLNNNFTCVVACPLVMCSYLHNVNNNSNRFTVV